MTIRFDSINVMDRFGESVTWDAHTYFSYASRQGAVGGQLTLVFISSPANGLGLQAIKWQPTLRHRDASKTDPVELGIVNTGKSVLTSMIVGSEGVTRRAYGGADMIWLKCRSVEEFANEYTLEVRHIPSTLTAGAMRVVRTTSSSSTSDPSPIPGTLTGITYATDTGVTISDDTAITVTTPVPRKWSADIDGMPLSEMIRAAINRALGATRPSDPIDLFVAREIVHALTSTDSAAATIIKADGTVKVVWKHEVAGPIHLWVEGVVSPDE